MNNKLFYNVDRNSTENFKTDEISKTSIGIVNANEGESFGYLISYYSQLTPSYNDINDIINTYMTVNQWNEKKQTIDRLAKNIYDLGVVATSAVAETNARNADICTNKDILIIKYTVTDGRVGTIYQNVTNGATYQYIEWDGFLKYRKLTWARTGPTLSVTSPPNLPWTRLFNADNGNLFANDTLIELSKYVTTNSAQTITAKKTFIKDVTIINGNNNNGTAIKSNIDPGELKVFTYYAEPNDPNNTNRGFTIRTTGDATNGLYPIQLLATDNTKSVKYHFPLTDNNGSNLPYTGSIKIITEKNIANVGSYGVTKLATVDVDNVTNGEHINHYTAASTYSISYIYSYLTSKVKELQDQINELNNNTAPDIEPTQATESTTQIQLNTIAPTRTITPESETPTPTPTASFMPEDTISELHTDGNTDVK